MATETPTQRIPLSGHRRRRFGDLALRGITGLAAVVLGVLMVLLVYEVAREAWPSIQEFGASFLTGTEWNAVTDVYGARDLIWGTLITSFGALLIAVPMSIAIGVFLSELAPRAIRTPVELLAAIPSVVLGLWGILVMGPFVAEHIEPFIIDHFGWIPFLDGYPSNQ